MKTLYPRLIKRYRCCLVLFVVQLFFVINPIESVAYTDIYSWLSYLSRGNLGVFHSTNPEDDYKEGYKHYAYLSLGWDEIVKAKVGVLIDLDDFDGITVEGTGNAGNGTDGWVTVYTFIEAGAYGVTVPPVVSLGVFREHADHAGEGVLKDPYDPVQSSVIGHNNFFMLTVDDIVFEDGEAIPFGDFGFETVNAGVEFWGFDYKNSFGRYEIKKSVLVDSAFFDHLLGPLYTGVVGAINFGKLWKESYENLFDFATGEIILNDVIYIGDTRSFSLHDDGSLVGYGGQFFPIRGGLLAYFPNSLRNIVPNVPNSSQDYWTTPEGRISVMFENTGSKKAEYLVAFDKTNSFIPDGWHVQLGYNHLYWWLDDIILEPGETFSTPLFATCLAGSGDYARVRLKLYAKNPLLIDYGEPHHNIDVLLVNENSVNPHTISNVTLNGENVEEGSIIELDYDNNLNEIAATSTDLAVYPTHSKMTVMIDGALKLYSGPFTTGEIPSVNYHIRPSELIAGTTYEATVLSEEYLFDDQNKKYLLYKDSFTFYLKILDPAPVITIASPNGGESYEVNTDEIKITWDIFNNPGDYVKLEFSRDGGTSWSTINDSTPNNGSYSWTASAPTSNNCLIRISSTSNRDIQDISDAPFSITKPCSEHSLKISSATISDESIKRTGSTDIQFNVTNDGSQTETNTPVTLTVTGPGNYSDSSQTTISSLAAGITTDVSSTWSPGGDGWDTVSQDGAYSLTASVISSDGCDIDYSDNQTIFSVYVSESGDPPTYRAYENISMYYFTEYGDCHQIGNNYFVFESMTSSVDEYMIKILPISEGCNGSGSSYWRNVDQSYMADSNRTIYWTAALTKNGDYNGRLWLYAGTADNYHDLDPYGQTVIQGETAYFTSSRTYDPTEIWEAAGSESSLRIDGTDAPGDWDNNGTTLSVDTTNIDPGTYRFAALTGNPSSTSSEYMAFGRFDVVARMLTLNLSKGGAGSGQVKVTANGSTATHNLPISLSYQSGTPVTLQAVESDGSRFTTWTNGLTGSTNPTTFTLSSNKDITANFIKTYSLNLSKTGEGSGQVKVDGSLKNLPWSKSYDENTVVNLEAINASSSVFYEWGGSLSGDTNPHQVTMTVDKNVTMLFNLQYSLNVTIDPSDGGSVYANGTQVLNGGSQTYTSGATVQLFSVAATDYKFGQWTGDIDGTTNSASLVMNENKSVTASFLEDLPLPGDVNLDNQVSEYDMALAGQLLDRSVGDDKLPSWVFIGDRTLPDMADQNDDGLVNVFDLVIISNHLGDSK